MIYGTGDDWWGGAIGERITRDPTRNAFFAQTFESRPGGIYINKKKEEKKNGLFLVFYIRFEFGTDVHEFPNIGRINTCNLVLDGRPTYYADPLKIRLVLVFLFFVSRHGRDKYIVFRNNLYSQPYTFIEMPRRICIAFNFKFFF